MNNTGTSVSVLFVCMGNICRSPTAEGVFRHYVRQTDLEGLIQADSAGTHAYHIGNLPDRRAVAAALRRGYSLEGIQARRVTKMDFDSFDFILAMDDDNLVDLKHIADKEYHKKISLFLSFSESSDFTEVPDPYYGGEAGFERVLDLVEDAAGELLKKIKATL